MPYCAVRWCGVNNMTEEFRKYNITFHRFPRIPRIKYAWVQAIRLRKEGWFPSYSSVICSRHFKDECFVHIPHKNRRRLREIAVPTEHLLISMQDHNIERFREKIEREKNEREKRELKFSYRLIPITDKFEGEQIITNVYHYLESQYITLRTYLPDIYDLSSMGDILRRTSDATGVCKETITDILKNEKMKKKREKFLMKQMKMEKFMKELELDRNYQIVEKFQNSVIQLAGPAPKTTPNNSQPSQSLLKTTIAKTSRSKTIPKTTTAKTITSVAAKVIAAKTAAAKPAAAKTIATKTTAAQTIVIKTNAAKTIPYQAIAAKTKLAKTVPAKPAKRQVRKTPKRFEYKEVRIAPKPPPIITLLPKYSPISSEDEGVTNMDRNQAVCNKRCTPILHHTPDAIPNNINTKKMLLLWKYGQQEHNEEPSGSVFGFSSDAEVENITVEPDLRELCLQEEPNYGEAVEENIRYTCDVQIQIQEVQSEPEYRQLYDYRIPIAVVSDTTLPTPDVAITKECTDNKIKNNITTPTYVQSLMKNIKATQPKEIKTDPNKNKKIIEPNITTPTYVQSLMKNIKATQPKEIKTDPNENKKNIEPNITTRNNQTVITHTNTLYNIGMKTEPKNHVIEPHITITNNEIVTGDNNTIPNIEIKIEPDNYEIEPSIIISNVHSVTDTAPTTSKVEMNTETERNKMQSVKLIINDMVWNPPDLTVFKYEPRSEFSDYYRNFV